MNSPFKTGFGFGCGMMLALIVATVAFYLIAIVLGLFSLAALMI